MDEGSYRDAPAPCPVCAAPMDLRRAGEAMVDVCPICHGLWIDWLDGDVREVTELAMPLSRRDDPPTPSPPVCPRCTGALERHSSSPTGLALWRCGGCAGTFLPRSMVEIVLAWDAGPASARDYAPPPLLAALLKSLRALFADPPTAPPS